MKRIKFQLSSELSFLCGYVIRNCHGGGRTLNRGKNLYTIYYRLVWLYISAIENEENCY